MRMGNVCGICSFSLFCFSFFVYLIPRFDDVSERSEAWNVVSRLYRVWIAWRILKTNIDEFVGYSIYGGSRTARFLIGRPLLDCESVEMYPTKLLFTVFTARLLLSVYRLAPFDFYILTSLLSRPRDSLLGTFAEVTP